MTDTYPESAGWRGTETSRLAALSIEVKPLQQKVLDAYHRYGRMTPEEMAPLVGMSVHNCRSRCSELKNLGLLFETGERHRGASGLYAEVLTAGPTP